MYSTTSTTSTRRSLLAVPVGTLALALALAGCGGGAVGRPTQDSEPTSVTSSGPAGADTSDSAGSGGGADDTVSEQPAADADLRDVAFPVSPEDAVATATSTAGDGTVHAIELDHDSAAGAWQYDVKILADGTDHKVIIDPVSGEVVGHEQESTSDQEEAIDLSSPMTYDEALSLATAERDGALHGWKLEWDDGHRAYQFDIAQGGDEEEVTVDVESQQVTVD